MTTKNINTMYQEALDILKDLDIEVGTITEVRWNNRLKSVWGMCYYNKYTNTYKIALNPILNLPEVSWEAAMDTMVHEVLHAHKDRFCHTGEWKRCAELINAEYPLYNIKRCTSARDKNVADKMHKSTKYVITCNECGHTYTYSRAGKIVKLIQKFPNSHGCRCGCGSSNLSLTFLI